jgi:glucose-1-phosphate cytidylyltransferase
MKCVILAGGLGTRLSEETRVMPKPMVEIGNRPILWHILKIYSIYGINEFVICCGYRGYVIKEYFANYFLHMTDITFDMTSNSMKVLHANAEPWIVTIVDTGENTMTGGRLKKIQKYVGEETFCMTYGDGVADVNVESLVAVHRRSGSTATLTAVQPPGRFGQLRLEDDRVRGFEEKPAGDGGWVNGGFFVLEPAALDYIDADDCIWERRPLELMAAEEKLGVYRHRGFWHAMDTLRDKMYLEELWNAGQAPWKLW